MGDYRVIFSLAATRIEPGLIEWGALEGLPRDFYCANQG
jgi:hypothetical protein